MLCWASVYGQLYCIERLREREREYPFVWGGCEVRYWGGLFTATKKDNARERLNQRETGLWTFLDHQKATTVLLKPPLTQQPTTAPKRQQRTYYQPTAEVRCVSVWVRPRYSRWRPSDVYNNRSHWAERGKTTLALTSHARKTRCRYDDGVRVYVVYGHTDARGCFAPCFGRLTTNRGLVCDAQRADFWPTAKHS